VAVVCAEVPTDLIGDYILDKPIAEGDGIKKALKENVSPKAVLMTDDARHYRNIAKQFAGHEAVNHSKGEYVRDDAHTNTVEGFFGVFKRGMNGTYQHCSGDHLHRYLAEFDFRYNHRSALGVDDNERSVRALLGIAGKRLTYKPTSALLQE